MILYLCVLDHASAIPSSSPDNSSLLAEFGGSVAVHTHDRLLPEAIVNLEEESHQTMEVMVESQNEDVIAILQLYGSQFIETFGFLRVDLNPMS